VSDDRHRLVRVVLEDQQAAYRTPDAEHERTVAIYDLLHSNRFVLVGGPPGPFTLHLSIVESRVVFDLRAKDGVAVAKSGVPLVTIRRVMKDYFRVCDSYVQAIRTLSRPQIEAIDVGRRSLHDEGSQILRERLAGWAEIDHDTGRRLFTLLCAMHSRG